MRLIRALLGPALIVGAVLVTLHEYLLGTSVAPGNADIHAFFLPNHCFLGESILAGRVPAWNPFQMAGIPFAADPQSGWMYAPVMLLYALLPCHRAISLFLLLQPLLAGLGIYAFLRTEALSRVAATCGGLVLALAIAGTSLTIAPSFSGTLAWTAVTLAAVARYLGGTSPAARCAWAAAAAIAWGQIAAAHFSHGFILGSGAIGAYLIVIVVRSERRKRTLGWAALLVGATVAVNLALFLPRAAYLPRTSLSLGYDALRRLGAWAPGDDLTDLPGAGWPLSFATSPGIYVGAIILVLAIGALFVRSRRRDLAIGFAFFGLVCFVLGTSSFANAAAPVLRTVPFGDFYLRAPLRFAYGLPLAFAIASAVGVDAWCRKTRPRDRMLLVLPGLAVWALLPPLAGARATSLMLFLAGCVVGAIALTGAMLRPALAAAIPLVLAVELAANGLVGQTATGYQSDGIVTTTSFVWRYHQLLRAERDLRGYLEDPVMETLDLEGGRLMTLDPFIWSLSRPMVFRIEETHGYNPVQLRRYWRLVHRHNVERIRYYTGAFLDPGPELYELFNVTLATGERDRVSVAAASAGSTAGEREGVPLLPIEGGGERAVFRTRWRVASSEESLRAVAGRKSSGDPVILETEPGVVAARGPDTATQADYRWIDPQKARVIVEAPRPGLVVIKNSYDPHWTASVNARSTPVLVADYVIQAVPVPAGRSVIDLRYHDPWIGRGAVGSAVSLMVLLLSGLFLRRMNRLASGEDTAA